MLVWFLSMNKQRLPIKWLHCVERGRSVCTACGIKPTMNEFILFLCHPRLHYHFIYLKVIFCFFFIYVPVSHELMDTFTSPTTNMFIIFIVLIRNAVFQPPREVREKLISQLYLTIYSSGFRSGCYKLLERVFSKLNSISIFLFDLFS